MQFFINRILLFILSAGIFSYIFFFVSPPKSWPEASSLQILEFFIPFLLTVTFLINIVVNSIAHSFIAGLGIMFLGVLRADDKLNLLTGSLTVILTAVFIKFFPKSIRKRSKIGLTRGKKANTLTVPETLKRIKL